METEYASGIGMWAVNLCRAIGPLGLLSLGLLAFLGQKKQLSERKGTTVRTDVKRTEQPVNSDLDPARGVLMGVVLGIALWAPLIYFLW